MTYRPNPRRAIPPKRPYNLAPDACLRCSPFLRSVAADFPCAHCNAPLCRHNDAGYQTCATCAAQLDEQAARDILEQQAEASRDFWS